jgi:hypothetical protein
MTYATDSHEGPSWTGQLGIDMQRQRSSFFRCRRNATVAAILMLTPMIVADADSSLAPAQQIYIENLLGQHASRYMLGPFARVPLQCAHEMHGA